MTTAGVRALEHLSGEQKRALLRNLLLRDEAVERAAAGEGAGPGSPESAPPTPMSSGQRGLWFLQELHADSAAYNLAWPARIDTALEVPALHRAALALMQRHEALRTVLRQDDNGVWQEAPAVWGHLLLFEEHDATLWSEAHLRERVDATYRRPFDLRHGPTVRLELFRQGAERHVLLLVVHHIFADAWSLQVMLRDLGALYEQERGGGRAALPALPWTTSDYVAWQRDLLEDAERSGLWPRWRQRLAGTLPVIELPAARPRPVRQSLRGASTTFSLGRELTQTIQRSARQRSCTVFTVLLSAFYTLLYRITRSADLLIGSPMAGRGRAELAEMVGYFVNLVPLRAQLHGELSFAALLEQVRQRVLAAMDDQDLPFDALVERLAPERDASRSPLVDVLFEYRQPQRQDELLWLTVSGESPRRVSFGGLTGVGLYPLHQQEGKFDLQLEMAELPDGIGGVWKYRTELLDAAAVKQLTEQLTALLGHAVAEPERSLDELTLIPEEETRRLVALGRPRATVGATPRLHDWFAATAARAREAVALIDGIEQLTYGELAARAARAARRLSAGGVRAGQRVGLCVQRSFDIVVGELAILRLGAAFVPLDPGLPVERLAFYIDDAGLSAVACHAATETVLAALPMPAASVARVTLEDPAGASPSPSDQETGGEAAVELDEDAPAYVIYTSGSTGKPKGVVVSHRNVARLFLRTESLFGFSSSDVWTLFHSFAFDFSIWEIWGALLYGGRLVIVPAAASRSPEVFHGMLRAEGVTVLNQTPSAFQELSQVDALLEGPSRLALRCIIFGGEALLPSALARWVARHGDVTPSLVNMYGITETCVHVTHRRITAADLERPSTSPIGQAIDDLGLYVLDQHLVPAPVGVAGELYVGGDGVALGYLNRPALTASHFVPDPFAGRPGQRLYRTGDLAKRSPSGELEYLGRIDSQVKIRGFRIELGEIEHVLRSHPSVRDAIVLPEGGAVTEHLLAYVVPRREAVEGSDRELANNLLERAAAALPAYMMPAAVLMIEALPLSHNGKIDRAALPRWRRGSDEVDCWQPPKTATERALAQIWQELLQVPRVGRRDRFFHIGGHSLLATRMILRVRHELGIEVPILAVFERPELAAFAETLDRARRAAPAQRALAEGGAAPGGDAELAARRAAMPVVERGGELPLGLAQRRLWFLDRLDAGSPVYNVPLLFRLRGPLDPGQVARALERIADRHEVLRTAYPMSPSSGQPVQHISPPTPLEVPVLDLRELVEPEREREAQRLATAAFHRPFELERAAPWRVELLRLEQEYHWLVLCAHHIALDGWSGELLLAELMEILRADTAGEPPRLPEVKAQMVDFAAWQQRWHTAPQLEAQLSYWRRHLEGAPLVLEVPGDHPRPPQQTFRGGLVPLSLSLAQSAAVRALALQHGATPFMVLLSVFELWLSRITEQRDFLVGSPVANRAHLQLEATLGCFVENLVFRARMDGPATFVELLAATRQETLGAYAHQDVPFELLVEAIKPPRDLSRNPIFQVMFALQNTPRAARAAGALQLSPLTPDSEVAKFDLSLHLVDEERGFHGFLELNLDLYERQTGEDFVRSFLTLLDEALRRPEGALQELEVLPAGDLARLLTAWNPPVEAAPAPSTIASRFAAQVAARGDAICLFAGEAALSYREVGARAVALAQRLVALGVGAEVPVGVCLRRTAALPIALQAVQLAGGACVPMDPKYPHERLAFLVEDSGMAVVILEAAERRWFDSLGAAVSVLEVDAALAEAPAPSPVSDAALASLAAAVPEDGLAYLIYTSGSTGRPKGVALGHGGITALLSWSEQVYSEAQLQGVLASTSVCFDLSIFELFVTWGRGGAVVLVEDLLELAHSPLATRVQLINTVPSAMAELVRMGAVPPRTAIVNLAGEPIRQSLVDAIYALGSVEHVYNLYGPTEDTVYSTGCRLSAEAVGSPPIGTALRHGRAYVLDDELRPVPRGVIGELYLGGAGLARGYHRRAALTAERFMPDPHGPPGARMYRTGDFARWRRDGVLEFLGRRDGQIKLRGFRIELGEIEEALTRLPGVREAAVLVRTEREAGGRLVAYVAAESSTTLRPAELRRRLLDTIPAHMVPASYAVLAQLPHTPNGKIDRRALPEDVLTSATEASLSAERSAAGSELEEELRQLWREVLEQSEVGLEDNFFDLGGHSLLLTRVHVQLGHRYPGALSLGELFQYPTVRALAARLLEWLIGDAAGGDEDAGDEGRQRAELRKRRRTPRRR